MALHFALTNLLLLTLLDFLMTTIKYLMRNDGCKPLYFDGKENMNTSSWFPSFDFTSSLLSYLDTIVCKRVFDDCIAE